jgi:hypothetical protein
LILILGNAAAYRMVSMLRAALDEAQPQDAGTALGRLSAALSPLPTC